MTVTAQTASVTLNGNSSLTVFNFSFEIPYQADGTTPAISCFTTTAGVVTKLTLGTDYTVSGVGVETGGSITFPLSGSPLPTGSTITINRNLFYTQSAAFPNEGFLPENVEAALDQLELQVQQLTVAVTLAPGPYVFATLPASPTIGQRAFITDSATPTWGSIASGGSTNVAPVFYNSAHWVWG